MLLCMPTLWFCVSDNIQFTMESSVWKIIWYPVVKHYLLELRTDKYMFDRQIDQYYNVYFPKDS